MEEAQPRRGGLLSLSNVGVDYHGVEAVRDISFSLCPGSITAVVGPNGAGKSTLAKAIAGVVPTQCGRMVLDGVDITKHSADWRARFGVGLLPDSRAIFPSLTVKENLRMGFRAQSSRRARASAEAAMELFPILRARSSQKAGLLSGGEQQMLAISRLAVEQPALLIADEMSHGLAPLIVEELFELVASLGGRITVLLIEQFVGRALACADRVLVLARGSLVLDGSPTSIDERSVSGVYLEEPLY